MTMGLETFPLPPADDDCTSCGQSAGEEHDDECLFAEHQAMLAGDEIAKDLHDPEECYWCLEAQGPTLATCRCGDCCRRLIIEVTLEDAKREPKIRKLGSPIYIDPRLTDSGQP